MEKQPYEYRFDPQSECLRIAIDVAFSYLRDDTIPYDEVKRVKSLLQLYNIFRKYGFFVRCECSGNFFLNPIFVYMVLRSYFETRRHGQFVKYAKIIYSSAYELYGIEDYWTHCITICKDENSILIKDPYYRLIPKDYGMDIEPITLNQIKRIKKLSILIWEDKHD